MFSVATFYCCIPCCTKIKYNLCVPHSRYFLKLHQQLGTEYTLRQVHLFARIQINMLTEHVVCLFHFLGNRIQKLLTVRIPNDKASFRQVSINFCHSLARVRQRIKDGEGKSLLLLNLRRDQSLVQLQYILRDISRLFITKSHIPIRRITIASTNAVVGCIFKQQLPYILHDIMWIFMPKCMADRQYRFQRVHD
ncbi:hypothetical protein D1872_212980 [compost metagenome]